MKLNKTLCCWKVKIFVTSARLAGLARLNEQPLYMAKQKQIQKKILCALSSSTSEENLSFVILLNVASEDQA